MGRPVAVSALSWVGVDRDVGPEECGRGRPLSTSPTSETLLEDGDPVPRPRRLTGSQWGSSPSVGEGRPDVQGHVDSTGDGSGPPAVPGPGVVLGRPTNSLPLPTAARPRGSRRVVSAGTSGRVNLRSSDRASRLGLTPRSGPEDRLSSFTPKTTPRHGNPPAPPGSKPRCKTEGLPPLRSTPLPSVHVCGSRGSAVGQG